MHLKYDGAVLGQAACVLDLAFLPLDSNTLSMCDTIALVRLKDCFVCCIPLRAFPHRLTHSFIQCR